MQVYLPSTCHFQGHVLPVTTCTRHFQMHVKVVTTSHVSSPFKEFQGRFMRVNLKKLKKK